MKQYLFLSGVGLCVFLSVLRSAFAYDLREYYPLAEGNRWQYAITEMNGSENILKEENMVKGTEMVGDLNVTKLIYGENNYKLIMVFPEGLRIYKDVEAEIIDIFDPPITTYFENGEKLSSAIQGSNSENSVVGGTITTVSALESTEDITVPAGTFENCLKFSIEREEKISSGWEESSLCKVWLAKGIGRVKEFCINTEEGKNSTKLVELIFAIVDGKKFGCE